MMVLRMMEGTVGLGVYNSTKVLGLLYAVICT